MSSCKVFYELLDFSNNWQFSCYIRRKFASFSYKKDSISDFGRDPPLSFQFFLEILASDKRNEYFSVADYIRRHTDQLQDLVSAVFIIIHHGKFHGPGNAPTPSCLFIKEA